MPKVRHAAKMRDESSSTPSINGEANIKRPKAVRTWRLRIFKCWKSETALPKIIGRKSNKNNKSTVMKPSPFGALLERGEHPAKSNKIPVRSG